MPEIPGLPDVSVSFGEDEKPLVDWRAEATPDDQSDDDDEPSEDDLKVLIGMLGFDPNELDEPDPYEEPPDDHAHDDGHLCPECEAKQAAAGLAKKGTTPTSVREMLEESWKDYP